MAKQLYICNRRKDCKDTVCYGREPHQDIGTCGKWKECSLLFTVSNNWKCRCVKVKPCSK